MKKKSLIFRKLEKKDLREVYLILSQISDFKPPKKNYNKIWINYTKQKNVFSIIAEINNEIVGFGSIGFMTHVRGGKKGYLENIAVKKIFQKKQIGSKIVKKLLDLSVKKKCYKVEVTSNLKNLKFYNYLNFKNRLFTLTNFLK